MKRETAGRGPGKQWWGGVALSLLAVALAGPVAGQEPEGLLEAVNYYHEFATSDLSHIHEATKRFEALAIATPADPEVADSWLPSYWTAFAYTQLSLFSDDERATPFVGLARLYYEKAREAHPDPEPTADADFQALHGLILSFERRTNEADAGRLRGEERAAWNRARELDPDNPMMLMNGGLALLTNPETRDRAYELLDRAIELYEPRLGTVRPNWGREFIDVWTGSYPRGNEP